MKTTVLFSLIVLSCSFSAMAQVTDGDGPGNAREKICKSSDPLLSAEEIFCGRFANYMDIHNPKYKVGKKSVALVNTDDLSAICQSFGAEKFPHAINDIIVPRTRDGVVKAVLKRLSKNGIIYRGKGKVTVVDQNAKTEIIETLRCQIFDDRPRAQVGDDGAINCYGHDYTKPLGRGERLEDSECHAGYLKALDDNGVKRCFNADIKRVTYGQSVHPALCDLKVEPLPTDLQFDNE